MLNPNYIIRPVYRNGTTPQWEHFYERVIWNSHIPVPKVFFELEIETIGKFIYRRFPPFHLSADQCSSWLEWIIIPIAGTLHGIKMLKVKSGENPLNENNQTGIASLLDYKVYSGQLSEIVVLQSESESRIIYSNEIPIDESHQTFLIQRGCDWCCCWNPFNN